jgi:hypothetical protein
MGDEAHCDRPCWVTDNTSLSPRGVPGWRGRSSREHHNFLNDFSRIKRMREEDAWVYRTVRACSEEDATSFPHDAIVDPGKGHKLRIMFVQRDQLLHAHRSVPGGQLVFRNAPAELPFIPWLPIIPDQRSKMSCTKHQYFTLRTGQAISLIRDASMSQTFRSIIHRPYPHSGGGQRDYSG